MSQHEELPRQDSPGSNFFTRGQINARLADRRPDSFIRTHGLRLDEEYEKLSLADLEREKLQKIYQVLNHTGLQGLIAEGKITVALIKPYVNKGKTDMSDEDLAWHIVNTEIKPPLEVVFSLPIWMTPNDVDVFYADVKPQLEILRDTEGESTVWHRHKEYMTSGAVTFVLLYSSEGNAIAEWRRQMGPTRPEDDASGESIRARFAFDVRANVTHGSSGDTAEEKQRNVNAEVDWMRRKVESLLKPAEAEGIEPLLDENTLKKYKVIKEEETFLSVEQFLPSQHVHSEGAAFTAYIVTVLDKDGHIVRRRIVTKDKNGTLSTGISDEVNRISLMTRLLSPHKINGVRVPEIYSTKAIATNCTRIVREYIPDHTPEMKSVVCNREWDKKTRRHYLRGLIAIAALLDIQGIPSKNLCSTFIFDGQRNVYIGGEGIHFNKKEPTDEPVSTGLADVLAVYGEDPEMSDFIKTEYKKLQSKFTVTKNQM